MIVMLIVTYVGPIECAWPVASLYFIVTQIATHTLLRYFHKFLLIRNLSDIKNLQMK